MDLLSLVFNAHRDASTIPAAYNALFLQQNEGSAAQQFDRELLTAWLNFANGAAEYNQLFDTNGDAIADTPFAAIVAVAETIRVDPNATEAQLRAQKNILHQLSLNTPNFQTNDHANAQTIACPKQAIVLITSLGLLGML